MATAATLQQNNISKRGFSYYFSIPRSLCTSPFGFSISAIFTGGLLASFSGKEDENGNKSTFSGTRAMIKDLIGNSPATFSRNMRQLKDAELVTRKGMSTYEFEQKKVKDDKKWSCPFEIKTRKFKMTDDDGNVFSRTLTPGACLSYSYFYTKLSTNSHKASIDITYKKVAAELGIDETTVADGMKQLRWAKLIYFPNGFVGKNRYKKSKVCLRRSWPWFRKEQDYRENKRNVKNYASATAAKEPKNGAITRDSYYDELQAVNKAKADEAYETALTYEEFRALENVIAELNFDYRKTLITDSARAEELSQRISVLNLQRSEVLESIGMTDEQFEPEYYAKCSKCKDTGWLPNGHACKCFKRRKAPPGRENGNVVGELNKKN